MLQDLRYYGQVCLKVPTNRLSNVSEALQDGWFELVAQGIGLQNVNDTLTFQYSAQQGSESYPKIVEKIIHESVAEWLNVLSYCSSNVAHQANRH